MNALQFWLCSAVVRDDAGHWPFVPLDFLPS